MLGLIVRKRQRYYMSFRARILGGDVSNLGMSFVSKWPEAGVSRLRGTQPCKLPPFRIKVQYLEYRDSRCVLVILLRKLGGRRAWGSRDGMERKTENPDGERKQKDSS